MSKNAKVVDKMYLDIIRRKPAARNAKKMTGIQRGEGLGLGLGGGTYRFLLDLDFGKWDLDMVIWDASF